MGQWCKETVYENDARVPLLVRSPWIQQSVGRHISQPVELVSVIRLVYSGNAERYMCSDQAHSMHPLLRH
jgi:hypothetical protein